jgi:hypothetical protein
MSREYSIRNVVRQHAGADTRENTRMFPMTPSQAGLAWWGLFLLVHELGNIPGHPGDEGFSDDLRCYADAIDWSHKTMQALAVHAKESKVEVLSC